MYQPEIARQSILQIKPYVSGRSSASKAMIKLSSNENPLGCSRKAKAAYKAMSEDLAVYPDGSCYDLRKAIAVLHNIDVENIVCGAGSDEILHLIICAYINEGDEIIISEHGFLMYKIYGLASGAKIVEAKDDENLNADIDNILGCVSEKTRIVFIANPNNPTGGFIPKDKILKLRDKLADNIILVIDGAYAEYVDEPGYTSGLELVEDYNNIIATRTFSKIYGLANLRIGWAYMPEKIADIINRVRGPFNVSGPAQAAALCAVEDKSFVEKSLSSNNEGMKFWETSLNNLGIKFFKSYGNFILVDFGDADKASEVIKDLERQNIFIRDTRAYKLPTCARITIGTMEQNQRVLESLKNVL